MVKFDFLELGTVCEVLNGDRGNNYPSGNDFVNYGIPFINAGHLQNGSVSFDNMDYITKEHYSRMGGAKLKNGDMLFCLRGSLGKYALFTSTAGAPASSLAVLRANTNKLDNRFLYQLLGSEIVEKQISEENNGSSQPNLSAASVKHFVVPIPNIFEQSTIAESLSDADSLIASLQKLIAKKKAIKQGAMQELLTGKKRLPGFNARWKELNLAKKSKLKARIGWQGLTTSEYLNQGYAYLITGTDFCDGKIDWSGCHFVDKGRYAQDSNIQIKNDDVLITKDGTIGKIAYVSGLRYPATLNSGVFVVRPNNDEEYVPAFIYHILCSFVFEEFLSKLSAGSTINHLYQKDLVNFTFIAPPTLEEQTAVAEILSDMDAEIEQLQKKLSKYQLIKQGMMQELLTGRIRLVNADTKSTDNTVTFPAAKKHSQQFDDAVIIAGIVDAFYSNKYPLGRVKLQKLLYLLRRKEEADISAFKKKAAGPYADSVRYKGGEPIAISSGYIVAEKVDKGTRFAKGPNIGQALGYIKSWGKQPQIDWLIENFQYTGRNDLELFATVDMAMCDLREMGQPISVQSIKQLIHSHKQWKAKLGKAHFSDIDIHRAISKCQELFGNY